jgi:hypothetical protein
LPFEPLGPVGPIFKTPKHQEVVNGVRVGDRQAGGFLRSRIRQNAGELCSDFARILANAATNYRQPAAFSPALGRDQ